MAMMLEDLKDCDFCLFLKNKISVVFLIGDYFVSVPIGLYGFQHYLSILGSLILFPLVIVPAMGGTYVSS